MKTRKEIEYYLKALRILRREFEENIARSSIISVDKIIETLNWVLGK